MKNLLAILLLPLMLVLTSADDPKTAEDFFDEGMELYQRQQFNEALTAFTKAIELKPQYAQAYLWRAITYDDMGNTQSSLIDYTKSIEIEPTAIAYNNRGIALAITGEYTKAIEDYNIALQLKPNYGIAIMNRGFAYYELGQKEKACTDWQQAGQNGITSAAPILEEYCN